MSVNCPSQTELKSFTHGELPDELSDKLLVHVQHCGTCQSEMETLESLDDTFVAEIRSVSSELKDEFSNETECRIAGARALGALAEIEKETSKHRSPNVPSMIGEYEIVEPLGRGGMGHVFLGRHTKLGRTVAIKFIAENRRWDEEMHQRFASEMRTVGGLDHPNIVAAHDAREVDGVAVLVTEYIDGLDVGEILSRNGRLSIADSCAIVLKVCEALSYVDSKGLVHRDIKPSNIMIGKNGKLKLLDLGLAKLQAEGEAGEFTATGQAIGTADYVAPEQINDGRNIDIRTDIYGLGCTFYKLLTGRAPFAVPEFATSFAKMNAHVSETPEPVEILRSDLPPDVAKLVRCMLAKSPADRPQSAKEIVELIRPFASGGNLTSLAENSMRSEPKKDRPWSSAAMRTAEVAPRKEPLSSPRSSFPWRAIAAAFAAVAFGVWLGITITVKKPNGETAKVVAPNGSTAVVDAEGNIEIVLEGSEEKTYVPAANVQHVDSPRTDDEWFVNQLAGRRKTPTTGDPTITEYLQVFEIGIATAKRIKGVSVYDSPIEVSPAVQYGRTVSQLVGDLAELIEETENDDPSMTVSEASIGETKQVWQSDVLIRNDDVARAKAICLEEPDSWAIMVDLTAQGKEKVAEITSKYAGEHLTVSIGFELVYAPMIHEPITAESSLLVHGRYRSRDAAETVARNITSTRKLTVGKSIIGSLNKIGQLGMALKSYATANGQLPPVTETIKGHSVSWRIRILPFIDQQALYDEYQFGEAWNSPSNKKLIDKMPAVFRHPDSPMDSTSADYCGVSGEGAFGRKLEEITDGLSDTVLLIESRSKVAWTQPDELKFESGKHFDFDPISSPWLNVCMCDGVVSPLKLAVHRQKLFWLFTRSGNESFSLAEYQ